MKRMNSLGHSLLPFIWLRSSVWMTWWFCCWKIMWMLMLAMTMGKLRAAWFGTEMVKCGTKHKIQDRNENLSNFPIEIFNISQIVMMFGLFWGVEQALLTFLQNVSSWQYGAVFFVIALFQIINEPFLLKNYQVFQSIGISHADCSMSMNVKST